MQTSGLLAGAACAPLMAHACALAANLEPRAWLTLTERTRWSLAPDALLFTTTCAIVCAPVFGAVIGDRRAHGDRLVRRSAQREGGGDIFRPAMQIGAAVLLFTLVSAVLTLGWRFGQGETLLFVTRSHVTLAAVAGALAAWGALCGAWFRNPLDAAGVSLLTTVLAALGLLVSGTIAGALPRSFVAAGLTASPLVAVASAAQIDLLHSDLLYQISPLAHMQIDYPTWTLASACYLAAASVCFLTLTATNRRIALSHR